ncbi:hypothetical protein AB1Y20_010557 [Prymnesium parvum]|uniref:Uncharacterized protein n=1 Tax=Prymnesium parvum TaxID=97485 RepID=A0AB34IS87_PRYPA
MALLSLTAVNDSPHEAALWYLPEDGEPRLYATLPARTRLTQATFAGHRWSLKCNAPAPTSAEIRMGEGDAELKLEAAGAPASEEGFYHHCVHAGVAGVRVRAAEEVSVDALRQAAEIVRGMLLSSPATVCGRLSAAGCTVSVIGSKQKTSDIPEHRAWAESIQGEIPAQEFLPSKLQARQTPEECDCGCVPCIVDAFVQRVGRGCDRAHEPKSVAQPGRTGGASTSRSLDSTTRGVGGSYCTSCGEENLLDIDHDPYYREESILVHEFGHTVMNVGMSGSFRNLVRICHDQALASGLYSADCYMSSCADEYWAEGTQSWFNATVRTDVNCGINTREKLRRHDPALALLLLGAYGDGEWRFTDTLPEQTRSKWREKQSKPPSRATFGNRCASQLKALAISHGVCSSREPSPTAKA